MPLPLKSQESRQDPSPSPPLASPPHPKPASTIPARSCPAPASCISTYPTYHELVARCLAFGSSLINRPTIPAIAVLQLFILLVCSACRFAPTSYLNSHTPSTHGPLLFASLRSSSFFTTVPTWVPVPSFTPGTGPDWQAQLSTAQHTCTELQKAGPSFS